MSIALHADPIPLRVDDTGAIRIGQSRVSLDALLHYWRSGMTPEEIAEGLDTLTLADIHGALAYYFRHQAEMDEYLQQRERDADKLQQQMEGANSARLSALRAKVEAAKTKENCDHAPASDG